MPNKGELVFPMAEYERRLRNLRALMEQRGMDAVILTMPHDLFYLTGFQTPGYYWFQALVVPLEK